jgi:hypothetical protein
MTLRKSRQSLIQERTDRNVDHFQSLFELSRLALSIPAGVAVSTLARAGSVSATSMTSSFYKQIVSNQLLQSKKDHESTPSNLHFLSQQGQYHQRR